MTNQALIEAAKNAWKKSKAKGSVAKRKCPDCYREWEKNGRRKEERPPLFPPDFEEPCPACGGKFSPPSAPL